MATLPSLPGCGQPATGRIEAYSPPTATTLASLDAVIYVCEQHLLDADTALCIAGYTPYRSRTMPSVPRECGQVVDFTTWGDR